MEQRIGIERMEETINLFGSFDENIRLLESEFQVTVVNRGGELVISGEPENVMLAEKAVQALLTLSAKGESISEQHVRYVIGLCRSGQSERIGELTQDVICITSKGRPVKPKTIGQKQYVDAIMQDTVTIGVGPAGTGKTYLAVAAAVCCVTGAAVAASIAELTAVPAELMRPKAPPAGKRVLLERVRPELAVISAGKGNSYGHPAPETLERLDGVGALIYRTDLQGTVVVRADGQAPAEG